ncbi:MAG: DUF1059 domain-containing protein [Acidimicrobiia bacterium]
MAGEHTRGSRRRETAWPLSEACQVVGRAADEPLGRGRTATLARVARPSTNPWGYPRVHADTRDCPPMPVARWRRRTSPPPGYNSKGVERAVFAELLRCWAGCPFAVTTKTEDELMQHVAAHASTAHPDMELTPDTIAQVKGLIRTV